MQGARGGFIEARSGYLPSLTSSGFYDKRQQQTETRLRDEDYNATLRLEQNLYTGGAVPSQVAIARLNIEKQNYELQEIAGRVAMEVRIAFNELLLNRAKVRVRQDSVRVLDEELKSQQQPVGGKGNVHEIAKTRRDRSYLWLLRARIPANDRSVAQRRAEDRPEDIA